MFKKMFQLSIFIIIFSFCNITVAKDMSPSFSFDASIEPYYYRYYEMDTKDSNSFLMSDKGPVLGINIGLEYTPCQDGFRGRLETRYAKTKNTHYQSNGTGESKGVEHWVSETRLVGIYPFFLKHLVIEGYAGLGFRYLNNDGSRKFTSTGHVGYLRKSRYYYLPIGIQVIKEMPSCGVIKLYLEYDYFIHGQQNSYLGSFIYNNHSNSHLGFIAKNKQRKGYGARVGVNMEIPSKHGNFDYVLGVFFRHWSIRDSNKIPIAYINQETNFERIGYGMEPKNKTNEIGIKFGIAF